MCISLNCCEIVALKGQLPSQKLGLFKARTIGSFTDQICFPTIGQRNTFVLNSFGILQKCKPFSGDLILSSIVSKVGAQRAGGKMRSLVSFVPILQANFSSLAKALVSSSFLTFWSHPRSTGQICVASQSTLSWSQTLLHLWSTPIRQGRPHGTLWRPLWSESTEKTWPASKYCIAPNASKTQCQTRNAIFRRKPC